MKDLINRYYVYVYMDPRNPGEYVYGEHKFDYEPFYIGKGTNRRYNSHLIESRGFSNRKNNNKSNIEKIRSILNDGMEPVIIKYRINLSENEAYEIEGKLIFLLGKKINKKGPLLNYADGGKGPTGYIHSDAHKEKMRIISSGKKHTEETKNKLSADRIGEKNPMFGKKVNDETRTKRKDSMIGKNSKAILQYDLDGNFIREWISGNEIQRTMNILQTSISRVCIEKNKSAGGFFWMFKGDEIVNKINIKKIKNKYILQYDINGILIKEWNSMNNIFSELGFNKKRIYSSIHSMSITYGYKWKYK